MDEQSRDQYVRDWRQFFATSSRKIHIVEAQAQKIERVKEKYNIPEDSVLGSIVYQTGGILMMIGYGFWVQAKGISLPGTRS
ncbi:MULTISPECIES: hypothetical protein [Brevibacillus]|uniref:hypothetical protein n=1 Tax=Brevibacillus TaxID=55080 RepID=UPI002852B832|nr:hypothetical protein [Brevibacillus laterosporus]